MFPAQPTRIARGLALAAGISAALVLHDGLVAAHAQARDNTVIRVLVGFPPGAGTDTLARIYAEGLAEQTGATVVVDNRPGAGGLIANMQLKNATPESNTIMFAVDHQVVILPHVTRAPGFDVQQDFVPIGQIAAYSMCVGVHPSVGARSVGELVEAARKDPQAGNYGIPAPGSNAQFMGYVIGKHYGVEFNPVPYRGAGPALSDLIGGQIKTAIMPCDAMLEQYKAGNVNVIAVADSARRADMPDTRTLLEDGITVPQDYLMSAWASRNTRAQIVELARKATRAMSEAPGTVARINGTGMRAEYADAATLAERVRHNAEFWGEQIRASGYEPQ